MMVSTINAFLIIGGSESSAAGGLCLVLNSHYLPNEFFLKSSRVVSCTAKIFGMISAPVGFWVPMVSLWAFGISDPRVTYISLGSCFLGLATIFYEEIVRTVHCAQRTLCCNGKQGLDQQRDYGAIQPSSPIDNKTFEEIELALE